MAGDIGGGQCRDDDQAPAVGERPLGRLHRLKGRSRLFSCCCTKPMRAWGAVQQAIGRKKSGAQVGRAG
jgi:hypothetical protein